MRVATYTRTATTGRQAAANLALRQRQLYDAVLVMPRAVFVAAYADYGSGRAPHRPGLNRAIADATARCYDVLVVDGCDRLSRDPRHLRAVLNRLGAHGVTVHDIDPRPRPRRPLVAGALSIVIGDFLGP